MLQGFQGYLQTDGYGAYEDFGKRKGITLYPYGEQGYQV
jgi:hypothetical protein